VTKLRPMPVNSNQAKRILRQPIGSGFFVYRASETTFQVVEFKLDDDGQLLYPDGSPFDYIAENGERYVYRWVREKAK